jgi:hypothetical protein
MSKISKEIEINFNYLTVIEENFINLELLASENNEKKHFFIKDLTQSLKELVSFFFQ